MKKSEFIAALGQAENLRFELPDGSVVPAHFHLTEAGLVTRQFVDCGGTHRTECTLSLQLWVATDTEQRLSPQKLLRILDLAAPILGTDDLPVEVEYQGSTIGRYGLRYTSGTFVLEATHTNCLALDKCGIPEKPKIKLADLGGVSAKQACCTPGGGCC